MKTAARWAALTVLTVASSCASPFQQIDEAVTTRNVEDLEALLSRDEPSYVRERTARAVRRVRDPGVRTRIAPVLLDRLSEPSERAYVRAEAGLTLSSWGTPEAEAALVGAINTTEDRELLYWLALALARYDGPDVAGTLEQLSGDADLFLSAGARQWAD